MTTVGILPAAGRAVRLFGLVDGSKETLLVRGRPVIDHVADAVVRAGAQQVRVVTRPNKQDVVRLVRSRGWHLVLGQPATAADSVRLGADGLAPDDIVLVGFPDTLFEPTDPFRRLIRLVEAGAEAAVGLFRSDVPREGDVVDVRWDLPPGADGARRSGDVGMVLDVEPKPAMPRGDLVWSLLAIRARAVQSSVGVTELGGLLNALAVEQRVRAVLLPGRLLDIGTPRGLEQSRGL